MDSIRPFTGRVDRRGQIQMLATRLSIWELALGAEHPDIMVDQPMLDETTKKKTKAVKKDIKTAVFRRGFLQARV